MAYLLAADFRDASVKWWTRGLTLTLEEIDNDGLTAAIDDISKQVDYETKDHFEPEPGGDPEGTMDLWADGDGTSVLRLPRRIRSVTALATRDAYGVETAEDVTTYRVMKSLNAAGTDRVGDVDAIVIEEGRQLLTGEPYWREGEGIVRVTGKFSWGATPGQIKRACALMVYDTIKPRSLDLRRAFRWSTGDRGYEAPLNSITGIPEADRILESYRRYE